MSMVSATYTSSLFILNIKIEGKGSYFKKDMVTKVYCLESAKIAGKRVILIKPIFYKESRTISIKYNFFS